MLKIEFAVEIAFDLASRNADLEIVPLAARRRRDPPDAKPSSDNAVDAGHKMTINFAPQLATVKAADVSDICGNGTGIFGRYTKDRKR